MAQRLPEDQGIPLLHLEAVHPELQARRQGREPKAPAGEEHEAAEGPSGQQPLQLQDALLRLLPKLVEAHAQHHGQGPRPGALVEQGPAAQGVPEEEARTALGLLRVPLWQEPPRLVAHDLVELRVLLLHKDVKGVRHVRMVQQNPEVEAIVPACHPKIRVMVDELGGHILRRAPGPEVVHDHEAGPKLLLDGCIQLGHDALQGVISRLAVQMPQKCVVLQ